MARGCPAFPSSGSRRLLKSLYPAADGCVSQSLVYKDERRGREHDKNFVSRASATSPCSRAR